MDVKPLHALVALLVFGTLLALASYSGMQAKMIQGPSDLQLDRNGDLHLRIGQQFFVYDEQGQLRDRYSLDDFNIEGLVGNFDFFSDNSVLLVPVQGRGPLQSLSGRLLRCERTRHNCTALAGNDSIYDRSIRMVVDSQDRIYLADTVKGRVNAMSPDGAELHQLAEELQRPNRLRLVDEQLVIAHTEAKEVLLVPLAGASFTGSGQWRRLDMSGPGDAALGGYLPLDLIGLVGDWWVLLKPEHMRSGIIRRYASDGSYLSAITLPEGADPFAVAVHGEAILVADYAGLAVYRYDSDGQLAGELDSAEQRAYVEQLKQRQSLFRIVQYVSWGLFALALVVGFTIAIKAELQKSRDKSATPEMSGARAATPKPHHLDARVHWLIASQRPLWLMAVVALLVLAMPLSLGLVTPPAEDAAERCATFSLRLLIGGATAFMVLILGGLIWKMRQVVATRIGVADEWVLVDRRSGPVQIARDEDLLRIANGFIIDGVAVPTGNQQMPFYDRQALAQWLQPRLERAPLLGPGKHLAWQWQNQRRMFILTTGLALAGLAAVLSLELGWFEPWFEQWLQAQPACAEAAQSTPQADTVD